MFPPFESRIREVIRSVGPLAAYKRLIAENDALIRGAELDNGRAIVTMRTAIHTVLAGEWAEAQVRGLGYENPFALVALGGTGREEMAPCSDTDFVYLFDDVIEGNAFLAELQRRTLHSGEFEAQNGFPCTALPFNLDDVPSLAEKQLNAFLDMRPVYDPHGLTEKFRQRIRSTIDSFEHFLYVRRFWKDHWEAATNDSERLDRFDIKNDGLRVFLSAIWTLAGKDFLHSHEIYEHLDDVRDLEAYEFLLRLRSWIHLTRVEHRKPDPMGNHPEDILGFEDFISFGNMLGADRPERERFEFAGDVRARLLSARRRIAGFAKGVIERELKRGRHVSPGSPIVYGAGGLFHSVSDRCHTPMEKSRAALSLLLASQHYGVDIDRSELQATFCNAGDWLVRAPEISALFYEQHGSLAKSFDFLASVDGAEERLFPGYGSFESSVDRRVMKERLSLRGPLERQKMRAVEGYVRDGRLKLAVTTSRRKLTDVEQGVLVAVEAALLDADHLAAVKLAIKTKRLPVIPEDEARRDDETLPLHERYASGFSGIPLKAYYQALAAECDFTPETIRTVEFLAANRRTFRSRSESGMNDARQVSELVELCGDEQNLRALFVFTTADHTEWESELEEPARWFNIRELYAKALMRFRPPQADPAKTLQEAGYSTDESTVLRDFGEDFFSGQYRRHANRFGSHLVRLAANGAPSAPKAAIVRDGASTIVGVATRDYRGLAASISGTLWRHQVDLRQAHLFSAMNHGLALDFFHVNGHGKPLPQELPHFIEEAIQGQLHITEADEAALPRFAGRMTLQESRPGLYCLQFETTDDTSGIVYALTYKIFRHLHGNIFGLSAHAARGSAYITVHHSLPNWLTLEKAQEIVGQHFE